MSERVEPTITVLSGSTISVPEAVAKPNSIDGQMESVLMAWISPDEAVETGDGHIIHEDEAVKCCIDGLMYDEDNIITEEIDGIRYQYHEDNQEQFLEQFKQLSNETGVN